MALADALESWFDSIEREGFERGVKAGRQEGIAAGRQEGYQQAIRELLLKQLTLKFGELPDATLAQIETLSADEATACLERCFRVEQLADVLVS